MFDSIAFLFSIFALYMFLMERYDYFFLLVAISAFFKYQAGIFLLPLIAVGLIQLLRRNSLSSLLKNKAVLAGVGFGLVSIFTASLSMPYLLVSNPQLIMNGVNAFFPNSQTVWLQQAFYIIVYVAATVAYSLYMLNKNSLLSLSALFILMPSFLLSYFQNWYLPFIFMYVLIPQQKRELEITALWLLLMITVLYFSGVAFNPQPIFANLKDFTHTLISNLSR